MSTLLEQASLVLIPSGYKEDVVYSQIPTDGSGDLSFTRASNGTRINSAGLVEVTPWNLVGYSNTFNNAVWSTIGTTLTSGQTDPNGGANAWKVEFVAGAAYLYQPGIIVSGVVTMSAYLRADSTTTIGFNDGNAYPNSVTIGTTWQRYEFSFNVTGTNSAIQFDNYFGVSPANLAKTFYIYGAQLNIGSTAKPYFPTTDRLNVPRLTYQNGGGGCPSLLLEKQSTNLLLYSEQFDNVAWVKNGFSITANAAISPDGTQNADLAYQTVSGDKDLYQITSSVTPVFSIYAKAAGKNWVVTFDAAGGSATWYNISNGTLGTVASGVTATIDGVGNGWYKLTYYHNTAGVYRFVKPVDSNNSQSAVASGTDGAYLWGAQLEASSYATSYIPTTSSSATRVADACYKTGISSLIGQTSGTMFVDFIAKGSYDSNNLLMLISAGSGSNIIYLNLVGGTIEAYIASSAIQQFLYTGATALGANTRHKLAIGYANNDVVLYHNGTQLATDTSATIPACTLLRVGDFLGGLYQFGNTINQSILFPTRLSNSELASLTSL